MDDSVNGEPGEGSEASNGRRSPGFLSVGDVRASPSESCVQRSREASGNRTKSRVKSSSRRMFLDSCLSDEEKEESLKEIGTRDVPNQSSTETQSERQPEEAAGSDGECVVPKQDAFTDDPQSMTPDNSWTRPLTSDDASSSDAEISEAQPSGSAKPPVKSKSCSGMILKLRRMFSGSLNRKRARYQAVSESGASTDPSLSQTEDVEGEAGGEGAGERRRRRTPPKVTRRWQRTGGFSPALRPLSASSTRKHRSLLKIKYCPYLSACHSAEHRRRWVLRSAVKRARRAMRLYYPDLVGKRIHHLYEEDDKSEVWYRGEVVRIHEAHSNPLKTIFEVRYDSEPEWKYYLELLIDYKKGWLKVED